MAGPPVGLFDAPRADAAVDRETLVRGGWLVVRRGLRLSASLLVVGVGAWAVFHLDSFAKLGAVLVGTLLAWLPATMVQWRVAFRPSLPEPWLAARDPRALADADLRALMRSEVGEWLLTSLPALALAMWFVASMRGLSDPEKFGLIAVLGALYFARQARVVLKELVYEAQLDLDALQPLRTRWVLERLARVPGIALRDSLLHLVARGRFRDGDVPGALAALDRIGRSRAWRTDVLRALFGIAVLGPDAVALTAEQIRGDPDLAAMAEVLELLIHVFRDEDDQVLAEADSLLARLGIEGRWLAAIVVAAAEVGTAPAAARERLAALPWPVDRVLEQVRGWPPVHRRLRSVTG